MTLEYLLVNFKEDRTVQANGTSVGVTNHMIMLPAGDYAITLTGDAPTPTEQDIELDGTSPVNPCVVLFS
jgi:hypothetical protein